MMAAGQRKDDVAPMLGKLGDNVKRRRLEAGLSQADLADLARVSQSQISTLEAGSHETGVVALMRIALALHVDPGELLRGIR